MKFRKQATTPNIENVVSSAVNFEDTIADLARRSERRAWWVAFGSLLMALIPAGGSFMLLPPKAQFPSPGMADAYTGTRPMARLRGVRWDEERVGTGGARPVGTRWNV